MTIQNKRIIASVLFVLISFGCMAQGFDNPRIPDHVPRPDVPGGPPPPPFPIDGGVLIALAAGLFYGVKKKVYRKKE